MPTERTSFFDRIACRIDQLDADGLQTVVQRLARERDFLEPLFDTIEDGVLVLDAKAHISSSNLIFITDTLVYRIFSHIFC